MSDAIRLVVRGLGQTLITLGLVLLLFCVYELQVTSIYTDQQQEDLGDDLQHAWSQVTPKDPLLPYDAGKGVARIYFPTLGKTQHYVVVEGVGTADLKKGPGHYPGTSPFGAIGNAVISGHRTTYGAPFNRLDELHKGDAIVVETQSYWYTYTVDSLTVVKPSAVEVTYPVPNRKGATPTKRLLTLTTCNPKYSARTRLVVLGTLAQPLAKGPGVVPTALEG
jgi:sortase A